MKDINKTMRKTTSTLFCIKNIEKTWEFDDTSINLFVDTFLSFFLAGGEWLCYIPVSELKLKKSAIFIYNDSLSGKELSG